MRNYRGINTNPVKDPFLRGQLEVMDKHLYELTAAIRKVGTGIQPDQSNTSLALAYTPPPDSVVSSGGDEGAPAVVSSTYTVTGIGANLPDTTILANPQGLLYRLNAYLVVTTAGTGNITLNAYWNDGTSPGAVYPLALGAAALGTTLQVSLPLFAQAGDPIYINTVCSGTPPIYDLYVKLETL